MAGDDVEQLPREIHAARRPLPGAHQEILDQIGVQETLVENWPAGVIDLYRTLNEPAPAASELDGSAAVWLDERRAVAFSAQFLRSAIGGLNASSRRHIVAAVAWHEYGHALSVNRATVEHRRRGLELLGLAPPFIREAVDHPTRYRSSQVFDEVIAHVYVLLVARVRIGRVRSTPLPTPGRVRSVRGGHTMARDPMNQPVPHVFPISGLVPLLRAMADPTGSGEMSDEDRAMIEQVEADLAPLDARSDS